MSSPGRFAATGRSHGTLQVSGWVSVAYLDAVPGEKYLVFQPIVYPLYFL